MPYTFSAADSARWSVEELDAATRDLSGPFANSEEKQAAVARYNAVMQAKRNSRYELVAQPLRYG